MGKYKKYNLRQGGEYKAECGNYHKKAGDDCYCLNSKIVIIVILYCCLTQLPTTQELSITIFPRLLSSLVVRYQ